MVRSKGTYLSNFYWRVKQRRGAKKAIIAVARKILVIIYHMLKNNEAYNEDKFATAKEKQDKRQLKNFITKARKLGLQVSLPEQADNIEQSSDTQSA